MSESLFKYGEEIRWSLPMLFQYEAVYGAMFQIIDEFNIRLPKAYLFGSPASAWSGGRPPVIYDRFSRETLFRVLNYVYMQNAVPTFTFSCTDITKDLLNDKYANMLLDAGLEVNARFIVYSDLLRDYIKSKKADATVIASVIKPAFRFQGANKIEEPTVENETNYYNKLLKEYDMVVVRPEYSKGPLLENPKLIDDISRIEVLINQTCINECPKMPAHYKFLESMRLEPNRDPNKQFECVRANIPRQIAYDNYLGHTEEQVQKLVDAGVRHLKLQGRSDNFPPNALAMLLGSQMFNLDGKNYMIATSLATGDRIMREVDGFNERFLGIRPQPPMFNDPQPPMQNQPVMQFNQQMGAQPLMDQQPQNQVQPQAQPLNFDQFQQGQMVANQTEQVAQSTGCCCEGQTNPNECVQGGFNCPYYKPIENKPKTQEELEELKYLLQVQQNN